MMCYAYSALDAGAWAFTAEATSFAGFPIQSAGNQNDAISFKLFLQRGTYTLRYLHKKGNNHGIAKFKLDGTSKGTIDSYAAVASLNNISSITNISVPHTGLYTLQLIVDAKNVASTAYFANFVSISMFRTA